MKSEQEERAAAAAPGASPRPRRGTAAAGGGDARGRMRPGLAPVGKGAGGRSSNLLLTSFFYNFFKNMFYY